MSDPFAVHGLSHLSPSSINLFAASPALFVMERLLKISAPVGSAAHRGKAAEDGIVAGLLDPIKPVEECQEIADKSYRMLSALCNDPNREKEGNVVTAIVKNGIAELRPYGIPTKTQGKVEHTFEGLCVPVIGFYDLLWENHGIIVDIKTQLRLSSSIKTAHARQVALYTAGIGGNLDPRITYVTDKKAATYHLENARGHLNALHLIALTMQRFCAISRDSKELAAIVAPDTDHFFINNTTTRQHVFEVFGY